MDHQIPLGFGMALAMNESAMKIYAALTEEKRQEILKRARNVRSKQEMQQIVDSLASEYP